MSNTIICPCGHGSQHHNQAGCWYGSCSTGDGCECRAPHRQETPTHE